MTTSDSSQSRSVAAMVGGAALLSTSAPWVRIAEVSPSAAGFYRMLVGSAALFVLCRATDRRVWRGAAYALRFLPVAAFFALDLFLWHRSIHIVGPGLATILANLQVFVMAGAGALYFGEKPGWKFAVGLLMALPGLVVLVGVDFGAMQAGYLGGVALGAGAAVAYSGFLIGMRQAQGVDETLPPASNLMYATAWCGLILAGLVVVEGGSFAVPTLETGGALVAYGLLCQVGGWFLITGAMPKVPASLVGLLLLLQPALAMIWDVLFFDRPPRLADLGGAALVLAGLYLGSLDRRAESTESS